MTLRKPKFLLSWCLHIIAAATLISGTAAQTAWVASDRVGSETRFLFGNQVQRYDVGTRSWLSARNLPRAGATAMVSDGGNAYVAYGAAIYRYTTDFAGETLLATASSSVQSLFLDGNVLIAIHSTGLYARVTSYSRQTGAQISTVETYVDSIYGASHAPGINRIYGRTQGISPADIVSCSYTDAGVVSGASDSPYHGTYPGATQTWVFPGEARVIDSAGMVYGTEALTYVGSLAGAVTDIAFNGDVPVVLRGSEVIAYSNTLVEAGRASVGTSTGTEIQVGGTDVLVFSPGATTPTVKAIPLASINAPAPGATVDPSRLAYTVDDAFQDENGDLLLFSKTPMSLFRWSPGGRRYTGSFPLVGIPKAAAYSTTARTAYFAYDSGLVRRMDLSQALPKESALFNLPSAPVGLVTAGEFIFAAANGNLTYSAGGTQLANSGFSYYSGAHNVWEPVKRRVYHFRDGISPSDLHWDAIGLDGKFTGGGETPYHGDVEFTAPIRPKADGSRVVIGSGVIFETAGMTKTVSLANNFTDAVWVGDALFSIRLINGLTQVQSWQGSAMTAGPVVRQFTGTPVRIFATTGGLAVITTQDGAPRFILLNQALDTVYQSPVKPIAPANLAVTARDSQSVTLRWDDLSDNEESFRIDYRIGSGNWVEGATPAAGAASATVTGLAPNTVHEFRVVARVETLESTPSAVVSIRTTSGPDEPVGEPYLLSISRIFNNRITLEWQDNASNETGFRILRSTTASGTPVVLSAAADSRAFTDTGLAANTTYYYRVQVRNGDIFGDLSAQVNARTLSSAAVPSSPSSFKAVANTAASVNLTWTDNSTNEDGFIIERSGYPATTWIEVARVDFNVSNCVDTTAQPDTAYSYRLRAWNSAGVSSNSTTTFTTPKLGGEFAGRSIRFGDRYYFAFTGPNRIERYDLAARQWLAPVGLNAATTALWADEAGIYVAEDRTVVRFTPEGGDRRALANADSTVNGIFTLGNTLVFQYGSNHTSLDKLSGVFLSTYAKPYFVSGDQFVTSGRRVFFRGNYGIGYLDIATDGKLAGSGQSSYNSSVSAGARLFLFPNGSRIAGDSGSVFDTEALASNNSLGTAFTDLSFQGADIPVVLRGNQLVAYSNTLLEAGSTTLTAAGLRVAVEGNDAVVFTLDGKDAHGMGIRVVPLADLSAPQPGAPVEPRGLPFTPDDAYVDREGNVLLFSKAQLSLFRWSPTTKNYLSTVPLLGAPSFAAYSPENHTAYFAYASQVLRKLDLSAPAPSETPLVNLPSAPRGLASAGGFLYVVTTGNNTYSPGGNLISNSGFTYYSGDHNVWDPVKRRVYHFRDGISPDDLHWDSIGIDGKFTGTGETLYHGDFTVAKPIRVSPDGSQVVIGSGVVFAANGLTKVASLANSFTDAVWHGGRLVTMRLINGVTQLQTWNGALFTPGTDTRQVSGTPVRLLALDASRLLLITTVDGIPRFTIFNMALEPVYVSPSKPLPPSNLAVTGRTDSSVSLSWNDGSDNEDGFTIEYRVGTGAWQTGASVPAGSTSARVSSLGAGVSHEFRVTATVADLRSAPSVTVTAVTLTGPDQPSGEPYSLRVTRVFHDRITLEWQDNATNETGFRILRSTTASGAATTVMADANATTFSIAGLSASTSYYFRVQAVNGAIAGDLSNQVSATTLSGNTSPTAPGRPVIAENAADHVTLTWQDNSANEESFAIERAPSAGTPWTTVGTVGFNRITYTDTTVKPDTAYNYRIRATSAAGSNASTSATVTTPKLGGEFAGLSIRTGNRYHFAFTSPDRIERYDLVARQWLPPVPLSAPATALWADEAGIYVAEDRSVIRFTTEGGNRTPMGNGETTVRTLFTIGNVLVFGPGSGNFTSLDKKSGLFLTTFNGSSYGVGGVSFAPALNRVFYRSNGISGIGYLEIGADGKLAKSGNGGSNNSSATRTFVFPNSARVADDSGTVYSTDSLTFTNSLGGSFTDLSFHGSDIPIVLRGNKLQSYSNTLLEAGSFTLATAGVRVAVNAEDALVFIADGTTERGLRVQAVPLKQLAAPEPGQPVDARGLAFTPDEVFVDRDRNLLMLSKAHLSIFRWSSREHRFLTTIPLLGSPTYAAYSRAQHALYLAYATQVVRKIDLTAPVPAETPLFNLPSPPNGLAAAGEFIFTSDSSGAWDTHYVFSGSGSLIHSLDWNRYSRVWEWDPVKRRMYFFRDDTSPNDLHWESIGLDGMITGAGETPYHGDFAVIPPIRVSPDGGRIVIGSGVVFETSGMTRLTTLPNTFIDAAWKGTELLSIRASGSQTQLQRWTGTSFTQQGSGTLFPGTPLRLSAMADGTFVLVTLDRGMPRIQLLGADLTTTFDYVPDVPRVTGTPPPAVEDTPFSWSPNLWQAPGSGTLTVTAPVLPSWLILSGGVVRGTPAEADSGDQVERSKTHRIVLQVRDGAGRTEQREFFVTVAWQNDAPALPALEPVRANNRGEPTDTRFGPIVIDPDGRDVHRWTLTGNSNPGLFSSVQFTGDGRLLLAYMPYIDGGASLTLQVTDASGASTSQVLDVILPKLPLPKVEVDPEITFNRATGLYDQKVVVTNIAGRAIAGFDLTLSGLGEQVRLYNGAEGVAGGGTFSHRGIIPAGAQVNLVLSYHAAIRGNVGQPAIVSAVAVPTPAKGKDDDRGPDRNPSAANPSTLPFAIERFEIQASGAVKLSFPAKPGTSYRVQSSNDLLRWLPVSEVLTIETPGLLEWSAPSHATKAASSTGEARFYRVERISP